MVELLSYRAADFCKGPGKYGYQDRFNTIPGPRSIRLHTVGLQFDIFSNCAMGRCLLQDY